MVLSKSSCQKPLKIWSTRNKDAIRWRPSQVGWRPSLLVAKASLLGARTLLVAPGLTTRNMKLLGTLKAIRGIKFDAALLRLSDWGSSSMSGLQCSKMLIWFHGWNGVCACLLAGWLISWLALLCFD